MSYKIKVLPEARLDIRDSIDWYDEQKAGLAQQLLLTEKRNSADI